MVGNTPWIKTSGKNKLVNGGIYSDCFMRLFSKSRYRWEHTKISMVHNLGQSPLQHHVVRKDIINDQLCSSLWYLHYPITLTEITYCYCYIVVNILLTTICYGKPANTQFTNEGLSTNCTRHSIIIFKCCTGLTYQVGGNTKACFFPVKTTL